MEQDRFSESLTKLRRQDLYRNMRVVASIPGRTVKVLGPAGQPEEKLVFCSNNYLSLAGEPRIIESVQTGVKQWGFGSSGSRLICGNELPHEKLQTRLAKILGKDACLVFPSGYTANNAVLSTLPGESDLVAVDKLVHASIIDGVRAGLAQMRTYPHRNLDKLKRLLQRGGYQKAFIVTDTLFSMDGDKADLEELIELKARFEAVLMVDEAHAFGCLGSAGLGCAQESGLLDKVDIFMGTFSKALGGAGGFVAGSQVVIDYLVNSARGFIYTTGIPAVNCIAAEAALDIIVREPQRRERLKENGNYFRDQCRKMNLDIGASESYIVPIILGEAEKALRMADQLWQRGYMIPAIRPPTVAPTTSRLRISLMSEHTKEDIDGLCEALDVVINTGG